jgi:hypothetical protein
MPTILLLRSPHCFIDALVVQHAAHGSVPCEALANQPDPSGSLIQCMSSHLRYQVTAVTNSSVYPPVLCSMLCSAVRLPISWTLAATQYSAYICSLVQHIVLFTL